MFSRIPEPCPAYSCARTRGSKRAADHKPPKTVHQPPQTSHPPPATDHPTSYRTSKTIAARAPVARRRWRRLPPSPRRAAPCSEPRGDPRHSSPPPQPPQRPPASQRDAARCDNRLKQEDTETSTNAAPKPEPASRRSPKETRHRGENSANRNRRRRPAPTLLGCPPPASRQHRASSAWAHAGYRTASPSSTTLRLPVLPISRGSAVWAPGCRSPSLPTPCELALAAGGTGRQGQGHRSWHCLSGCVLLAGDVGLVVRGCLLPATAPASQE